MWKRLTMKDGGQQHNVFGQTWNRLTLRKTVQNAQEDFLENPFSRPLNFFHLNTLGLGAIIGAGIFVLSGTAAGNFAGPSVIISFLIAGFVAFLAAFSYAEMSSMVPTSGSSYTYVYTTMGEFSAWLVGWDLCLEYICAAATVGVAWSNYVATFIESVSNTTRIELRLFGAPINWNQTSETFYITGSWFNLPALVIIFFLGAILTYDIDVTATFNSIIVVLKIVILVIFIFTSVKHIDPENYKPFIPKNLGGNKYGVEGMFHATTLVFFAYIGFDVITTAALETKKSAEKLLPLSILTSLSISTVLYLGVTSVMVGVVKYTDLHVNNPISAVPKAIGLRWLEIMVNCGAILGLTSVILVNMYGLPRILYAMARDGLLPKVFAITRVSRRASKRPPGQRATAAAPSAEAQPQVLRLWEEVLRRGGCCMRMMTCRNARSFPTIEATDATVATTAERLPETPFAATITTGVICAICAGFLPVDFLAEITSIGTLFAFLLVHIGTIVMHWTHPPSELDNKRLITFPSRTLIFPLLGVGTCALLMHYSTQWTKVRFGVWTGIGQIIYWSYSRSRSILWKKRHTRATATTPDTTNVLHYLVIGMRRRAETVSMTRHQIRMNSVFKSRSRTSRPASF